MNALPGAGTCSVLVGSLTPPDPLFFQCVEAFCLVDSLSPWTSEGHVFGVAAVPCGTGFRLAAPVALP